MTSIPSFYRIWFTIIDPLLSLLGIISNLFSPAAILNGYSPNAVIPPAPETAVLLDTTAAFLAGFIVLQTVLLRARPNDLVVWRILQASTLLVDFALLGSFARALTADARLDLRLWRAAEWTNIGITGGVAVIRAAFCLGVGMGMDRVNSVKNA